MKKYLNYNLADLFDFMINKGNPLIIKTSAEHCRSIKVQTMISENFKEIAI
jgi:hypothetical protein